MTTKTKAIVLFFLFILFYNALVFSRIVSRDEAIVVCRKLIEFENINIELRTTKGYFSIAQTIPLVYDNKEIGYIVQLKPNGFIISPGITELSPAKFISFDGTYGKLKDHPFIRQIIERIFYTRSRLSGKKNQHWATNGSDVVDTERLNQNKRIWIEMKRAQVLEAADFDVYAIPPMLTSTWSQGITTTTGNAYNMYTPTVSGLHTYTGCSATAQAQVMYYWKYPTTGTGSHSYLWNGTTLSANFNHTYYWDSMVNNYDGSQTPAQEDAVGRLMSDVGISIDMDYGLSGSGAVPNNNNSLYTFFNYSSDVQYRSRSSYASWDAWFWMFKGQLDNG